MGRGKADLPEKMRPHDHSAESRETLVGQPELDERGASGSAHFQPHCWGCPSEAIEVLILFTQPTPSGSALSFQLNRSS
jgi:hypothetical protein